MNKKRLIAFILSLTLSAFVYGCSGTSNSNTNIANPPQVASETPAANSNRNAAAPPSNTATPVAGTNAPREDSTNKASNNAPIAKVPERKIGSGGNDLFLFTKARAALNSDAGMQASGIVIDIKDNVATLTGTVPNAALKSKAEQLVKGVDGIKSVNNRIRVAANGAK